MKETSPTDVVLREMAPPEGTLLRVFHLMGLLRQILEPFFARHGLSGPQWAILRILQRAAEQGEGALAQKEISRRLLIQPPSVTALVDRLARLGLLERRGAVDLRVRLVALTGAGRERIAQILEGHPAQVRAIFDGLKGDELAVFHGMLGKLAGHLAPLAEQAQGTAERAVKRSKVSSMLERSIGKKS